MFLPWQKHSHYGINSSEMDAINFIETLLIELTLFEDLFGYLSNNLENERTNMQWSHDSNKMVMICRYTKTWWQTL